jgi:hypothetical protein
MNEFAALLYDKVNNLEQGTKIRVPYAAKYKPFSGCGNMEKSDLEVELNVLSSLFFLC